MGDCDCTGGQATAQDAAAELYQLAALMLGDAQQAAEVAEATVAQISIDPCAETKASMSEAREHLVKVAVARLSARDPKAFNVPGGAPGPAGCIEEDDLAAAGVSASELAGLLQDPGRGVLRDWLNKLPTAQRAVFVLRAIMGWDNATAAAILSEAAARDWQAGQVSELFRQALCSLATSLAQTAKA